MAEKKNEQVPEATAAPAQPPAKQYGPPEPAAESTETAIACPACGCIHLDELETADPAFRTVTHRCRQCESRFTVKNGSIDSPSQAPLQNVSNVAAKAKSGDAVSIAGPFADGRDETAFTAAGPFGAASALYSREGIIRHAATQGLDLVSADDPAQLQFVKK